MKRKIQKQKFPENTNINRYYYPLNSRRISYGIPMPETVDPEDLYENSLFDSTDPNGSYTGTPIDGGNPIQDADDL